MNTTCIRRSAQSTDTSSDSENSAIDPATINPLIIVGSPRDTMLAVSEVLAFLSGAMEAAENSTDIKIPISGGCTGLSRILDTCRAALDFQRLEGGAE